jgi:hypothetical protein
VGNLLCKCCAKAMQRGLCTERAVHQLCIDGAVFKRGCANKAVPDMSECFAGKVGGSIIQLTSGDCD